ncbi:MAG: thiamine-binding protein [Clostridia bacterium]|nr:thiamine-binding protein [Clostridia bacterium]
MKTQNPKASVAIQVLPSAKNQDDLIRIVDEVIAFIKSKGLKCHVGPFETTIEGEDYNELMDIVKECQHVAIRAGAERVSAYVKIVYRPDGEILSIDKKISKHAEA